MMLEDLGFQIKADGGFLKVAPTGLIYYDSNLDWDKNWIRTVITVQGGIFSGRYNADLTTFDFDNLKCDLEKLYENLSRTDGIWVAGNTCAAYYLAISVYWA